MSFWDSIGDVVSDVSDVVGQGVEAWNGVVGVVTPAAQPGTAQTNPSAPAVVRQPTNADLGGGGPDYTNLMLIGGAVVLLVVLLK